MKMKYFFASLVLGLASVLSFANESRMSYYTISTEKVEEYAKQDLLKDTAAVFDTLDRQKAFKYGSRSQMAEKINEKFKAYPQHQKIVNNFIQTSWTIREDTVTDVMGKLNMQAFLDNNSIDSLKWYIVDDAKNQMVFSQQAYDFVKQMLKNVFLDSIQLHRYAKSLLASSFNLCSGNVNDLDEYVDSTLESFFSEKRKNFADSIRNVYGERCKKEKDYGACMEKKCNMRQIYSNVGKIIASDVNREKRFIDRYSGRICSDDLWKKSFDRLDSLYSLYFKEVVDFSLVKVYNNDDASIILNSKSSGASHKEELNGEIVGFYPYWYAGDTTKWVDFEGITRLAYYGLKANNDGSLVTPSGKSALMHFDEKENYEFVNEVHRHKVKLDWVVLKDDWKNVSLESFFAKLTGEIDELLNKKINSSFQRFVNAVTFNTDELENRGDGVTLFFKNFPKDSSSTSKFNNFFGELKNKLAEKNESVYVNLMMNQFDLSVDNHQLIADTVVQVLSSGIYSYNNFLNLLKSEKNETKNYLYVVLDEPSSRNKQILLNDLNLQLDGLDRRNMLNSLVPVVWFDNVGWDKFSNDALYYNDSYYNFGVGPYATDISAKDSCVVGGNLGACMLKYFENENGDGSRQGKIASFVCMHRWGIRFVCFVACVLLVASVAIVVVVVRKKKM